MSEVTPAEEHGKIEHRELRHLLQTAEASGGRTGAAATAVMRVLFPHMVMEETYAMPPLKLLPRLARGDATSDMSRIIDTSETLRKELPRMLEDHKQIVLALRQLMQAAAAEGHDGYAQFATKLIAHAQLEEDVLYPAAILVGDYLRLRLNQG
ncbi:MAG: hemerythrin domain-containing protein [Thermoanaerobaculia bacterium]|nr:hemerythrin domain-containing protein [Thermoanaerobaculia bacterium]